jgi:DedD protein
MDRSLKERLIGASILVLIAVLVIPELLSGPRSATLPSAHPPAAGNITATESTHTVTMDVASSRAPAAVDRAASTPPTPVAIPAPAPAPKPVVAAEAPKEAAVSQPEPAPKTESAPKDEIAPTERAAPVGAAPPLENVRHGSSWAVQLGSFVSAQNANKLLHELSRRGYSAYIVESRSGGHLQHKVRVGPAADRAAAERILVKLRSDGHSGALVAPSR